MGFESIEKLLFTPQRPVKTQPQRRKTPYGFSDVTPQSAQRKILRFCDSGFAELLRFDGVN